MSCRRNTNQRIKVMERLKSVKTHPTAEQVYVMVKKELPAITLATVYRNLNLLAEEGKALKLEINGEYHFDGDCCCHQHCVCEKCGGITDIFQKEISGYAMSKLKAKGFEPKRVTIKFSGICKKCRGDKND